MIERLYGKIVDIKSDRVTVNCSGVGYQVFVSSYTISEIAKLNKETMIYTFLKVSENEMVLYGFSSEQERDIFIQLGSVSGIGSKSAMSILSTMKPSVVVRAVLEGDFNLLSQSPGIGKKTAQKIILELKDKFTKNNFMFTDQSESQILTTSSKTNVSAAIQALVALGYKQQDASILVSKVLKNGKEEMSTQEIITLALKSRLV
ncbi:MAG: Holliday junction branch migration protein RuvA [Candidatus Delongbacteria bacterium]|nr:Holliday junction branch migration protein RuvA [Candidatus Delongbacteria bacterium]MBN2836968.1 Holliday junction branch migration protein RuvA [Candidatus Delongbacteria bacterium]